MTKAAKGQGFALVAQPAARLSTAEVTVTAAQAVASAATVQTLRFLDVIMCVLKIE
ncbi:hypothetical protein [Oceanicella sp. SM1341]|uniref:hypothetical protein n=1 Tax=Oceanicella sp. SM1341 TaxID=1548889 RepID=UPI0013006389|nr:hypothetical protein [Oceanicella sp. SM1341]